MEILIRHRPTLRDLALNIILPSLYGPISQKSMGSSFDAIIAANDLFAFKYRCPNDFSTVREKDASHILHCAMTYGIIDIVRIVISHGLKSIAIGILVHTVRIKNLKMFELLYSFVDLESTPCDHFYVELFNTESADFIERAVAIIRNGPTPIKFAPFLKSTLYNLPQNAYNVNLPLFDCYIGLARMYCPAYLKCPHRVEPFGDLDSLFYSLVHADDQSLNTVLLARIFEKFPDICTLEEISEYAVTQHSLKLVCWLMNNDLFKLTPHAAIYLIQRFSNSKLEKLAAAVPARFSERLRNGYFVQNSLGAQAPLVELCLEYGIIKFRPPDAEHYGNSPVYDLKSIGQIRRIHAISKFLQM